MKDVSIKSVIIVPVQFPGKDYPQKRIMIIVGETQNDEYICNNFTSDKRNKDNSKYSPNVFIKSTEQNNLKYDSYVKCDTQYIVQKNHSGIFLTNVQISDDEFNTIIQRTSELERIKTININESNTDILKEYTNQIEETLKTFKTDPELMKEFVTFSAKFYSYSLRNKMLIYMQNPYSTFVASYTGWQQLGYNVQKGARALKIYRPIETVNFLRDGKPVNIKDATNEEKIKISEGKIPTIKEVSFVRHSVFDISQTTCSKEDYPKIYSMGYASIEHKTLYELTKDFIETSGFTVDEKDLPSISLNGYCNTEENSIVINSKLNDTERLNTLLHEFAHGLLHKTSTQPSAVMEFEAESLSMMLHHRLGLEINDNSKLYVCNNYKKIDKESFDINNSFERLGKAFKFVENGITQAIKAKGIELSYPRSLSNEKEKNISIKQSDIVNKNFLQEL